MSLQKYSGGHDDYNSSSPINLHLNVVSERLNRTIMESALALLIQVNIPRYVWPFLVKHVTYGRKKVQHSKTGANQFSVLPLQTRL